MPHSDASPNTIDVLVNVFLMQQQQLVIAAADEALKQRLPRPPFRQVCSSRYHVTVEFNFVSIEVNFLSNSISTTSRRRSWIRQSKLFYSASSRARCQYRPICIVHMPQWTGGHQSRSSWWSRRDLWTEKALSQEILTDRGRQWDLR